MLIGPNFQCILSRRHKFVLQLFLYNSETAKKRYKEKEEKVDTVEREQVQ